MNKVMMLVVSVVAVGMVACGGEPSTCDGCEPGAQKPVGDTTDMCREGTCSSEDPLEEPGYSLDVYIQNTSTESRVCSITFGPVNPKVVYSGTLPSGGIGGVLNAKTGYSWFATDVQVKCSPTTTPELFVSHTWTVYTYAHDACRFTFYEPPAPAEKYFDADCWAK